MIAYAAAAAFDLDDRDRSLARLKRLARLMDTALRIPGTGIRFGADFGPWPRSGRG